MFDYFAFMLHILKTKIKMILGYSTFFSILVAILCFLRPLDYVVKFTIIPEDNYQKSVEYLNTEDFIESVFVSYYNHPVQDAKQYHHFKSKIQITGVQKNNFIDIQVKSSNKQEAEKISHLIFTKFKSGFIAKGLTVEAAAIFTFKLRQQEVGSKLAFYKAELAKPESLAYIQKIPPLNYEKIKVLANLQADLAISSIGLTNLDYMESTKSLLDIYINLDDSLVKGNLSIINNLIYYYYWDYIDNKLNENINRLNKLEDNKIKMIGGFKALYNEDSKMIVICIVFLISNIFTFLIYFGIAEFNRAKNV